MTVKAVVFDIGDVLEKVGDDAWPEVWATRWADRAGLDMVGLEAALARHEPLGDLVTGEATEEDFRRWYADALDLDEAQTAQMMAEMWDGYCGELDQELYDFYVSLAGTHKLGILSNSMDGARREEGRRYDFLDLADVVVYSHEVGLAKPDPAIYALTTGRLGVAPEEIAYLDDKAANVVAARKAGWHAVHHLDTGQSIAALRLLL